MNDLTPRLRALCELAGGADTAADIGCDHGILSVFLAETRQVNTVWASDISAPSLEKARLRAKEHGCGNISFFLGNGFDPLPQKPDVAVMAGFGGRSMAPLLAHPFARTRLILQPMCDSFVLYDALDQNGFLVETVRVIREGHRFYEIIAASPGQAEAFDHILPPPDKLIKDVHALAFLQEREHQVARMLRAAQAGRDTQARQLELRREETIIKEMLLSWQR